METVNLPDKCLEADGSEESEVGEEWEETLGHDAGGLDGCKYWDGTKDDSCVVDE